MRGDFITRWRERGVTSVRLRSDNGALQLGAVQPDSPGARAGAKVGNRLLSVDGRSVAGMGEGAASYLASPKPGETVTLTVETPGSEAREIRIVAEKLKR